MKYVLIFILFFLLSGTAELQQRYQIDGVPDDLVKLSSDIMIGEVGKAETGKNRGIADKYNKVLGLPLGSPYCQSGQYWSYWEAASQLGYKASSIPMPRSGMAYSTYDYIKRKGYKTVYTPQINDFIVWRHPANYTGHIERIIAVGRAGWVVTVGFNTSSGVRGSQRDGGGVYFRKRNILHPLARRPILGLAGVNKIGIVRSLNRPNDTGRHARSGI